MGPSRSAAVARATRPGLPPPPRRGAPARTQAASRPRLAVTSCPATTSRTGSVGTSRATSAATAPASAGSPRRAAAAPLPASVSTRCAARPPAPPPPRGTPAGPGSAPTAASTVADTPRARSRSSAAARSHPEATQAPTAASARSSPRAAAHPRMRGTLPPASSPPDRGRSAAAARRIWCPTTANGTKSHLRVLVDNEGALSPNFKQVQRGGFSLEPQQACTPEPRRASGKVTVLMAAQSDSPERGAWQYAWFKSLAHELRRY